MVKFSIAVLVCSIVLAICKTLCKVEGPFWGSVIYSALVMVCGGIMWTIIDSIEK
jgi:hypothetical protein